MHQSIKTTDPFSFANIFVTELNRINSINNIQKHSAIRESILTIIESKFGNKIINREECLMRQDKLEYDEFNFKNSKDEFNQLNVEATRYYFVSGIEFEKEHLVYNPFISFSDYSPADNTVIVLEDEFNRLVKHLAIAFDKDGKPLRVKFKELPYIKQLSEFWRNTTPMFGAIEDFYRDNKNLIHMDHFIKCTALFKYIEYIYNGAIDLDDILLPLLFTMECTYVPFMDEYISDEDCEDKEWVSKLKSDEEIPVDKECDYYLYRNNMEKDTPTLKKSEVRHIKNMAKSIKDIMNFTSDTNINNWNNNVPNIVKIAAIVKNFENEWLKEDKEVEA